MSLIPVMDHLHQEIQRLQVLPVAHQDHRQPAQHQDHPRIRRHHQGRRMTVTLTMKVKPSMKTMFRHFREKNRQLVVNPQVILAVSWKPALLLQQHRHHDILIPVRQALMASRV